ncbi:hypothetical protein [Luteimonas salinilitoris]|uniref:Uncharacterized protein n=1 Tax=Luteimonas salinilitoris TaxID=3237697 RepID=A0ABV4HKD4_9GAMM
MIPRRQAVALTALQIPALAARVRLYPHAGSEHAAHTAQADESDIKKKAPTDLPGAMGGGLMGG